MVGRPLRDRRVADRWSPQAPHERGGGERRERVRSLENRFEERGDVVEQSGGGDHLRLAGARRALRSERTVEAVQDAGDLASLRGGGGWQGRSGELVSRDVAERGGRGRRNDVGQRMQHRIGVVVPAPALRRHAQGLDHAEPRALGTTQKRVDCHRVWQHETVRRLLRRGVGVDDDGQGVGPRHPDDQVDGPRGVVEGGDDVIGEVEAHRPVAAGAAEREEDDALAWREAGEGGHDGQELGGVGGAEHGCHEERPLKGKMQRPDLRNHRKLLVVDGNIAFLGSQNITDSTYNLRKNIRRGLHWVDLMVRLDGPVVLSVNAIFLSDWYSETDVVLEEIDISHANIGSGDLDCQVVPSGPGFEVENNLRLFLALLYAAKKQIMIVSPYFVPDEALLLAVTAAVDRGVEVQLFVSEEGDQAMVYHAQRSYYEALLRAGVRIWMYRKPYILHTKSLTIDDEVAVIGSSNMDMRSFGLNLEVSMLVRGEEFVAEMREVEDKYRSLSRELTLEEWLQQPLRSTVLDNLARLTSALQ
ncbi:unnamed protein product [Penicillium discolor]